MAAATNGDTVKVHYTGTLEDGREFDSSVGRDPLQFTLGSQQVIPGFENAVEGMSPGDKKTVTIEPDEAYGQRTPAMVQQVALDRFPSEVDVKVGMQFSASGQGGRPLSVTVVDIDDDNVTVDAKPCLGGPAIDVRSGACRHRVTRRQRDPLALFDVERIHAFDRNRPAVQIKRDPI